MDELPCPSCQALIDPGDNFCRHCGVAAARLPAVRGPSLPRLWQPDVTPVVKGAAVMAAGTVGQFLLRRIVGRALGGARRRSGRLPVRRAQPADGMVDDAQIITEMVMMRRVRVRRQA